MLKKIAVSDLRLGMHLHALEGSWLEHPFWRSKFVLADPADVLAVQGSGLTQCWIDISKGFDVASSLPAATLAPEAAPATRGTVGPALSSPPSLAETAPVAALDKVPPPSASFEDELERAAQICHQSKQAVQKLFGELRMGKALNPEAVMPMVEELAASVFRNPGALVTLARLKTKDDYTYMHSVAVCALMVSLARERGLGAAECRNAGLAGLLHDVGKALMPLDVLNKPGKLTDAEFDVMRSHPVRGHAILAEAGTAGEVALDVCLHHHERIDGTGYPHRLAGDAITEMARMGAICDVYDAISSSRPYKHAWDPADSIARMASWAGHFDARLFAVFVRSLGIYPTGSLVRMRSGRLGVVTRQNEAALTSPVVKVFFSTKSSMPIAPIEIDLARRDASDAISGREPREKWQFPHLDALWGGDAARH